MSSNTNHPSPIILVEGEKYPVDPVEVLGFSSPLSDEVITVLVDNIRSKSNSLQISLLDQLQSETKRARRGEVESRNKTNYFHGANRNLKDQLDFLNQEHSVNKQDISFKDINTFSAIHLDLIKLTAIWIRARTLAEVETNGMENCLHQDHVLSDADITKSCLFRRIRQGKSPLVHIPPNAFGQPWYEILESDGVFPVIVDTPKSLTDKLLANDAEGTISEKILINKCEWTINKVVTLGHEYQLKWPNTSFVYKLERSNNLLDGHDGNEQGWTLQKIQYKR